MARIALDRTFSNLTVESGVCTEKELLSCLTAGIERTAHLSTAERTVCKHSAILPGKRNALGDTLVDDVAAYFSKTIDICLAAAIVTSLDGLIEKTVDRVIVILVVLRSIDTTLCSDRMCTTRGITDAEHLHIVTEFTERSSCRRSSKSGSYDDDLKFPLVAGIDNTKLRFMLCPLHGLRTLRNLRN